jgi:hypothetical protein
MSRIRPAIPDDVLDEILEDERAAIVQGLREQTYDNVEAIDTLFAQHDEEADKVNRSSLPPPAPSRW